MSVPARATQNRIEWRVHTALVVVQLVFALIHVVAKAVVAELHPFAVAGYRVALATPTLLALAWWYDRRWPALRDLPYLALLGFLGVFANQLLFLTGVSHTTATNSAILIPSIPVFAAALGAAFGIERLDGRRLTGIALSIAGAWVLLDPGRFDLSDKTLLGNLLVLGNCLSFAAFLVLQRPLLERLPWRTVIAWAYLFGSVGVLAVSAPHLAAAPPTSISGTAWLQLLYIGLISSALGYGLNTWALQRSSASLSAGYTTLQPLIAATLAALFLGETLGWRQGAGMLLILGGLAMISAGGRR